MTLEYITAMQGNIGNHASVRGHPVTPQPTSGAPSTSAAVEAAEDAKDDENKEKEESKGLSKPQTLIPFHMKALFEVVG